MQPLFIDGSAGKLFAAYWPPAGGMIAKAIVHVPAFAEEMNKSRRMVALQARQFANQGYAVLVLDLFGTGDSAGDFGKATWEIWLQNIDTAIAWLKRQGAQTVDLWGLRTGALLAMDFANRDEHTIEHLLLWQPVLNGETFITQFLRLRVAAAIMDNNAPREKTSDLKRQLLEGQAIEVAGYLLNPDLIKPFMALRADRLPLHNVKDLALFEVVANEENPLALGNTQFFERLQENRIKVSLTKVIGDNFWTSQEISEALDLIKLSSERVEQWQ